MVEMVNFYHHSEHYLHTTRTLMLIRDIRLQYIGDILDVKVLHQMFLVLIFPKIVFILVTLPGKIQKKK